MLKPFADEDSVYRLLEPVQRAPSVHNTQPWYFRIAAEDRIDICARFGDGADAAFTMNQNGRLAISPALRRELIISCGAALYNLRLAIRVTGHDLVVWLLPRDASPLVLASVEIVTGRTKRPTATEQELYEAIPRRHTNRWPYDDRHPVPPPILVAMQNAAATDGGSLRVLGRRQVRKWLREAHGADREQRDSQGCQPDLAQWTNGGDSGLPPPSARPARSATVIIISGGTSVAAGPIRRSGTSGPALTPAPRKLIRPSVLAGKTTKVRLRPRASNAGPSCWCCQPAATGRLTGCVPARPSSTPC